LPVKILPWSEDREASLVAGFDIGIMPLSDGPWERGKCGYKLIQYMAVGKPVVASAVGANVEIVTYGACGELVSGPDDWIRALDRLLEDSELRDACGSSGRRAVEERYSLQAQASVLAEVLMSAARSRGNC
jgi:glycosyltransferase involved in cell wall biosynthesis